MMRLLFSLVLLVLAGCTPSSHQKTSQLWMQDNGKLKVLSTTGMIGDLVQQIGGDHVDNLVLIAEQLDPHSYQLVKGDDEKFARAQVIFYSGLNLEHGPSLDAVLRGNPKAVGLGNEIKRDNPEVILRYENQDDPHIWMDISLWSKAVPYIVETLSKADPKNASEYSSNGNKLLKELKDAHAAVRKKLQSIPSFKRYLVTSHDAFNYFARAYLAEDSELKDGSWSERFAAPEGLAPDSQLSTKQIQDIIDHLDKYDIMVLFPESNVSKDSIRKIVDAGTQKGLAVIIASDALYGDAMGPAGSDGDTYIKMITHNADIIAKYLKNNGAEERRTAFLDRLKK